MVSMTKNNIEMLNVNVLLVRSGYQFHNLDKTSYFDINEKIWENYTYIEEGLFPGIFTIQQSCMCAIIICYSINICIK